MQLISKYKKGIKYLLCVIDLFSKYAWVVFLKYKKGVTVTNAFQTILDSSKRKPNKIWVDQGSEFYSSHFRKWLKNNNIKMYSTYNGGRSVIAEIFIKTLKNKIYKNMRAISKNVYFDVLDDIADEYNNTYHRIIKMKPIDVKDDFFLLNIMKNLMKKIPNLKLVIMSGFQGIKLFLLTDTVQIGPKRY